jgi:hypothetical protein
LKIVSNWLSMWHRKTSTEGPVHASVVRSKHRKDRCCRAAGDNGPNTTGDSKQMTTLIKQVATTVAQLNTAITAVDNAAVGAVAGIVVASAVTLDGVIGATDLVTGGVGGPVAIAYDNGNGGGNAAAAACIGVACSTSTPAARTAVTSGIVV